jgi:hypothetical protein
MCTTSARVIFMLQLENLVSTQLRARLAMNASTPILEPLGIAV